MKDAIINPGGEVSVSGMEPRSQSAVMRDVPMYQGSKGCVKSMQMLRASGHISRKCAIMKAAQNFLKGEDFARSMVMMLSTSPRDGSGLRCSSPMLLLS